MGNHIRIGTRESQLAVWQAQQVKQLLLQHGLESELVYIRSGGDIDLKTPLYEMGVQGIFTKELDIALLNQQIDIAVHSMKDVPTQLPKGLVQAAVLPRGPVHDLLVFKDDLSRDRYETMIQDSPGMHFYTIATSSIRRKAQWLHKFPHHTIENLRGNVNTRLNKLNEENWNGAIFAQAGLERINLRPSNSVVLDWMLPAPSQGAIMVACRENDEHARQACEKFNDVQTALCTKIEKDFLRALMGGCSTPISGYAYIDDGKVIFKGNILTIDGRDEIEVTDSKPLKDAAELGTLSAAEILKNGGQQIADQIRNAGK